MKTIRHILTLSLLCSGVLLAQPNNLFEGNYDVTGYGGFSAEYFTNDVNGLFTGGHGAMLINNRLSIGGGGMGGTFELDDEDYSVGYGGPAIGYTFSHEKTIHPAVHLGTYFGGGEAENLNNSEFSFFSLQPKLAAEVNVTDFLRFQLGAGYSWFWYYNNSDVKPQLDSPSVFVRFNFGWFGGADGK